ncbi:hypothetical protein [Stenotrophomonas sepilia]
MITPGRFHIRIVPGRRMSPLLVLLAATTDAAACQRLGSAYQGLDDNGSVPNVGRPDYRFGGTVGFLRTAYRCPPSPMSFQVEVALAGLTHVRDIHMSAPCLRLVLSTIPTVPCSSASNIRSWVGFRGRLDASASGPDGPA